MGRNGFCSNLVIGWCNFDTPYAIASFSAKHTAEALVKTADQNWINWIGYQLSKDTRFAVGHVTSNNMFIAQLAWLHVLMWHTQRIY